MRDAPVTRIEDARAQRTRRLGWLGGGAAVAAAAAAVLMWQTSRDGATDRANHEGERIKGAGLLCRSPIANVGATNAALDHVVQGLINHVPTYAELSHQSCSGAPQVVGRPSAAT